MIALVASWALHTVAPLLPLLDVRTGTGTVFGPSATDSGNPDDTLACRYPVRLTDGDMGVASYALPCGSRVAIWHGGRLVVVPVIDRGPRRTMRDPRLQATDLDLTTATARALGFDGGALVWAPVMEVQP